MKKVLVPKVRFKGFEGEWKEYKFNDIGSYYSTSSLSYNDLSKGGQYKCVLYGELYTKYNERIFNVISRTNKKITLTQPNDILFPTSTTVDSYSLISPSCVNEENVMAGGDLFGIRPYKNINGNFISYYINNVEYIKNKLANKAQGLTIIHLYYKNILNENLYIASLEEQNKIGKLLDEISNLINLENSKLNKLKQLKETLLQKIFPEGNSKYPRIRFKGFSKEWKEEKLEYIAKVTNGKSNTSDNNKWGQYNLYIRSEEIYKSNKYIFDVEGVITVGDGNIGKIFHYVNGKFDLHQRCYLIYEFQNIWPKYFYYYFSQNFYKRAILMSYTATVNSIRMNTITDMDIMFPKELIEQQKIGDFFCKIDTLINLYNSKLNKLKQIKEALLQKLLI
ncbi:restriction endonuclease subunit S [Mycoplasmopsis felis]|uniref:restriction endonuclease subunit S n=1 Tax=Mycoplasmopsis felis TaxID=33923 RepID=UPI003A4D5D1E